MTHVACIGLGVIAGAVLFVCGVWVGRKDVEMEFEQRLGYTLRERALREQRAHNGSRHKGL